VRDHVGLASTLAYRVAAIVRQRVLAAEPGYEPGARLMSSRLAVELGVSITPVREALQLLAAENLVELSPHRGVRVAHISPDELEDLLRVRAGLQTLAVRFQDGRLSPASIALLQDCLTRCADALDRNDVAAYRHSDREFHRQLAIASGSPRLASLYESLSQQAAIVEIYFPHQPESMRESLSEHWALLHQLAEGDASKSDEAMEEHGRRSIERARVAYATLAPRSRVETSA
jgi:DNA-binding GntR family transcriptional regulator